MSDTVILEWDGKEYELKYSFSIVRRLRSEGIRVPRMFREITTDPETAVDWADDIAYIVAWLLREAGCVGVTDEDVFRQGLGDRDFQKKCYDLFMWVATQHFKQSDNLPKPTAHETEKGPTISN